MLDPFAASRRKHAPRSWFEEPGGALTPVAAGAAVACAFGLMAWSGARFSPAPTHPAMMRWYLSLKKPRFTPPGLVFALGWFAIEGVLGVGGYRLLRSPASPKRNAAVGLWAVNNALIASWSAIFFGKRALAASTIVSAGMIGTAGAYGAVAAKTDRTAGLTAVPLASWLTFATVLAEEVWRRNRR